MSSEEFKESVSEIVERVLASEEFKESVSEIVERVLGSDTHHRHEVSTLCPCETCKIQILENERIMQEKFHRDNAVNTAEHLAFAQDVLQHPTKGAKNSWTASAPPMCDYFDALRCMMLKVELVLKKGTYMVDMAQVDPQYAYVKLHMLLTSTTTSHYMLWNVDEKTPHEVQNRILSKGLWSVTLTENWI